MRIRSAMFFLTGLLFAAQANAAGPWWEPKFYAGFGGGKLVLENSSFRGFKEDSTAWQLFTGFEFNKYIAVETAWMDGGKPSLVIGSTTDRIDNRSIIASAIGSFPFNEAVSVYGRVGLNSWRTVSEQNIGFEAKETGLDPIIGIGVNINIDTGMLRLEYDLSSVDAIVVSGGQVTRYQFDEKLIWLSIGWKFGF